MFLHDGACHEAAMIASVAMLQREERSHGENEETDAVGRKCDVRRQFRDQGRASDLSGAYDSRGSVAAGILLATEWPITICATWALTGRA
jgi:hypothetical protein